MTATALRDRRELAHRTSDGIEITLFWSKLDAFNHPYAYAATRPLRIAAPLSVAVTH